MLAQASKQAWEALQRGRPTSAHDSGVPRALIAPKRAANAQQYLSTLMRSACIAMHALSLSPIVSSMCDDLEHAHVATVTAAANGAAFAKAGAQRRNHPTELPGSGPLPGLQVSARAPIGNASSAGGRPQHLANCLPLKGRHHDGYGGGHGPWPRWTNSSRAPWGGGAVLVRTRVVWWALYTRAQTYSIGNCGGVLALVREASR